MRYARALLKYARETGTEDKLYAEIRMLERSFRCHQDLRGALDNPMLTQEEKNSLITLAAVGNGAASPEFGRFIALVLQNGREDILQYICLAFMELYRSRKHIGVARVTTAVPVSRELEERIRNSASSLLHARMELYTEVDPAIEGGFIFDINDYRLDASIATQLKRVKEQFIDKNRRIV